MGELIEDSDMSSATCRISVTDKGELMFRNKVKEGWWGHIGIWTWVQMATPSSRMEVVDGQDGGQCTCGHGSWLREWMSLHLTHQFSEGSI